MLKEPGYNTTNKLFTLVWLCLSQRRLDKEIQHEVAGKRERGRPRKTWQQCVSCNLKFLKLSEYLTSNRNSWREALRMPKTPARKKCGTWAQSGQVF